MKQLHPVYMSADFEITLPQPLDLVTHPDNISVGGFFAIVNGRGIPFDFDSTSCDVEKINDTQYKCHYESGEDDFFKDPYISDCYTTEYLQIGLDREDITADFLASASELREFYVVCWDEQSNEIMPSAVRISDITFLNGTLQEFPVAQPVIDAFNAR